MFSKELQEYAQGKYDSRMCFIETLKKQIQQKMDNCTLEEQILMKFFYGTMPLRDLGEYDFEVFLGFVRHGLMLRRNAAMQWIRWRAFTAPVIFPAVKFLRNSQFFMWETNMKNITAN